MCALSYASLQYVVSAWYCTRIEHAPQQLPAFQITRLREATQAAGVTQMQIAVRLGLSLGAVNNWYIGRTEPRGDTLIGLARVLGQPAEFFYEDDPVAA